MLSRALDILVCPRCQGELRCEVFTQANRPTSIGIYEVVEGLLTCDCGAWYPVIGGVPRLLRDELKSTLLESYPSYFQEYRGKIPFVSLEQFGAGQADLAFQTKRRTLRSFSFEWAKFPEMIPEWEENFRWYFYPQDSSFFKDKLVLDAGCGKGRHAYYAARFGAEVVGIDLSQAVDAAYRNTYSFPNVHIVQADIYDLPFKEDLFDFVYCLGVLHHLPMPEQGLANLLRYLKRGAYVCFYVYWNLESEPGWKRLGLKLFTLFRRVSTRLPYPFLYWLTYLIASTFSLVFVLPYKVLKRALNSPRWVEEIPFKVYGNYPFCVLHQDQFDRFSAPLENRYGKQEVIDWLKRAHLVDIRVLSGSGWRAWGKKV